MHRIICNEYQNNEYDNKKIQISELRDSGWINTNTEVELTLYCISTYHVRAYTYVKYKSFWQKCKPLKKEKLLHQLDVRSIINFRSKLRMLNRCWLDHSVSTKNFRRQFNVKGKSIFNLRCKRSQFLCCWIATKLCASFSNFCISLFTCR